MANFAERIRYYRLASGLTQKDIAAKFGLTESLWKKYEIGQRRPTFEGLITLADFFHIPVEFLIGRLDPELCTIIESIAGRESHAAPEQMSVFLRRAAESYMEENCLEYYPDLEEVATEEEHADYMASLLDACDIPEPEKYSD